MGPLERILDDVGTVGFRELASRNVDVGQVRIRLLWDPSEKTTWIEIRDGGERFALYTVEPDEANNAFKHPYAYLPGSSF